MVPSLNALAADGDAMVRIGLKALLLTSICASLCSCWDQVTIQDLSYITAMGIEYEAQSAQYKVYGQILDFTKVAKQEVGSASSKGVSYVGHAEGPTPNLAVKHLYQSMQMEPNIDHVMTLVVADTAMPHLKDVLDGLNRSRAVRYTVKLLATSDSIETLFHMSEQVGKSPMNTDIYQPDSNTKKLPFVVRWDLQKLTRSFAKPGAVTFIPKLDAEENHWKSKQSMGKSPTFNGACILNGMEYKGKFTDEELAGVRWFRGATKNIVIPVKKKDRIIGATHVKKTSHRIRLIDNGGASPSYRLKLNVYLILDELLAPIEEAELEQTAAQTIRDEIRSAQALGISRNIDFFGLEENAYRYHNRLWKKLKQQGVSYQSMPVKVDVQVRLIHSGKIKQTGS